MAGPPRGRGAQLAYAGYGARQLTEGFARRSQYCSGSAASARPGESVRPVFVQPVLSNFFRPIHFVQSY